MQEAAGKSDCLPADGKDWQMLVLGYRGTLAPEPEPGRGSVGTAGCSTGALEDFGAAPPRMEALTEPWLAKAQRELVRRIPKEQRIFSGERIPVEGLLEGLRGRLRDIATLAVGACLAEAGAVTDRDFLGDFPGLEQLLRQAVFEWVIATVTFCERLQRDASRLAEWLGVANLPRVKSVYGTAADTHPGGHEVLRVVFEDGRCLYYKPRAVTGEWLWRKLLDAIGALEPTLRLPAGRVLEGRVPGRYGWMESVRPEDSTRRGADGCADGTAYWHAAGAMLCLAYHAALTDLHMGNLIATPVGPVVTDAECLGTPELSATSIPDGAGATTDASRFLGLLLETGLLPGRGAGDLPDVSGLFGASGPVSKLRLPMWQRELNGGYRLRAARAFLRDHGNAPADSRLLTVMPDMLAGYRAAASTLLRARKRLIAAGAPWRCVLEHEHAPRIVVRDTLTYGLLLSRSLEPGGLSASHSRRITLFRALQQKDSGSCPGSVLRAELHALLRLHIPRLILLPGSRTLASHSGRLLARNFAHCMPAEEVVRRMEELSTEHLEAVQVPALLLAMFHGGVAAGRG